MGVQETIYIKKYEAALKAAEDCRKREVSMINYSMIIYGASMWGISYSNVFPREIRILALIFLALLMGAIGLYIAKLNIVELKHFEMEKKVYEEQEIRANDYSNWPYPGLNKNIICFIYLLTILFSLICSLFIVDPNIIERFRLIIFDWLFWVVLVFVVLWFVYAYHLYRLIHCMDRKANDKKL